MIAAALWLYRLLMVAALPALAPWLLISNFRRRRGSPPLRQRLGFCLPSVPTGGIWVQAVSVGEVAAARSILVELRRRRPGIPLIISSTTATGLKMAADQGLADAVVPFTLDLPFPVRRFLGHVRPRIAVLVETELWPETLHQCRLRRIPVVLVNARISDHSFRRYDAVKALLRPLLQPVTKVLAQEACDAHRLAALGVARDRISVTGNIKFDIPPPGVPPALLQQLQKLAGPRPVWVAGSTVSGEEPIVLNALLRLDSVSRPLLVLAPRHPERAPEVLNLVTSRGLSATLRSAIDSYVGVPDVLLLDTIGELAALYQDAFAAFIGGSLVPTGGHNPIEPARFGVPVLTGPHVRNFAAVYARFLAAGAAVTIRSEEDLAGVLTGWLRNPEAARRIGAAGRNLLAAHAGATARVADAIEGLLT